jgi:hypothetical protein
MLRVPFISRMKAAVWAAFNHLRNELPLDEVEGEADQEAEERTEG